MEYERRNTNFGGVKRVHMQKAVFLDRDGVLNREIGDYVTNVADFDILPDVIPFLQELQARKYLLIVITNQGGIAKGLYTHETLSAIHQKMLNTFTAAGITLTEIYYSPHHPDISGNSLSRKPDSILLEKALARFDIDPANSYFIGDADRDVVAGKKAGVQPIKVDSNTSLLPLLSVIQ